MDNRKMSKIKYFWVNGGGKAIEWGIILTLLFYIVSISYTAGKNVRRIEELEKKVDCIEQIQKDIASIKTEITFIKEILQRKYK